MKRRLVAFLIALLGASVAYAGDASPVGSWESATGESRYKVTLCGDGTELCAKLTWLRDDARTEENLRYLNTFVVRGAKAAGPNTWQGLVDVYGESAAGKITFVSDDKIRVTGCRVVMCQSMDFNRL